MLGVLICWCVKCWFDVYYKHTVRLKINVLSCAASGHKMVGTDVSFNKIYFKKLAVCLELIHSSLLWNMKNRLKLYLSVTQAQHLNLSHAFLLPQVFRKAIQSFWRWSFFTSTDRTTVWALLYIFIKLQYHSCVCWTDMSCSEQAQFQNQITESASEIS